MHYPANLPNLETNLSACQRLLEVCAIFLERAECSLVEGKSARKVSAMSLAEAKSARKVSAMSLAEGKSAPEVSAMSLAEAKSALEVSAMSLAEGKNARKVSAMSLVEGKSLIFTVSLAKSAPDQAADRYHYTDSSPPLRPSQPVSLSR